eukprot:TRINITY_DN132790_c0_g2_i1.p1 TRINITY_DN132790_c0_g2~~TRINITY_DN132790_c0_g2_i1.p1  ORF type:complete len:1170 (-),score=142.67 TRINITY_DN132790_c0_g2_i1:186-3695(-)
MTRPFLVSYVVIGVLLLAELPWAFLESSTLKLLRSVRPVTVPCGKAEHGMLYVSQTELIVTNKNPVSSNTFSILKNAASGTASDCAKSCSTLGGSLCSSYSFFRSRSASECHLKRGAVRKITFGFEGLDVTSGLSCDAISSTSSKCSNQDDSDGDGVLDCEDVCPFISDPGRDLNGDKKYDSKDCDCPMHLRVDSDSDGVADCFDLCPGIFDPVSILGKSEISIPDCRKAATASKEHQAKVKAETGSVVPPTPAKLDDKKAVETTSSTSKLSATTAYPTVSTAVVAVTTTTAPTTTTTLAPTTTTIAPVVTQKPTTSLADCFKQKTRLKGAVFFPHDRAGAGIASPAMCQKKCQAYQRCSSWTMDYKDGCIMFVDTLGENKLSTEAYATSGPKYCDSEPGIIGGCLEEACEYQDEKNTARLLDNIATPWRCQTTCQLASSCVGFTFDYEEALCTLLRKLDSTKKITGVARHKVCGPKTCSLWNRDVMKNIIYISQPLENLVEGMLAKMSLEQKIGQMVLTPDAFYSPEAQLEAYQVNVLWGPGYKLQDPILDLQKHFNSIYYFSNSDSEGTRVAIPSLIAVDAVHGLGLAKGATIFPHNIGLGAANDTDLMKKIGRITAVEMTAVGADWTLSPMTAVTMDIRWGRTYESFSMDGNTVSRLTENYLLGLQGDPTNEVEFLQGANVPGMCKHFLADGAPLGGFTDGDADVSEDELVGIHGLPFEGCMRSGMVSTMPSFNDVNGWEMHQNRYLINDVLKGQFGFDGVVLSDWNAHQQIMGCPWAANDCPIAINAGVDMFLVAIGGGSHWTSFVKKTQDRVVKTKDVSEERINDAARRILRMKARMGLIGANPSRKNPANRPGAPDLLKVLGSKTHMKVAQEASRKSLVLLKNNKNTLPLGGAKKSSKPPIKKLLLTGKADEAYLQHGAWTLDWQGQDDDRLLGYASTLREALQEHLGDDVLTYDKEGQGVEEGKFDCIVHVMAEHPYAEVEGDLIEASLMHKRSVARTNNFGKQFTYPEDFERLQWLKKKAPKTPIIVILYSGRPLYINAELNIADAFIAAWLPGSMAGEAIVDMLFQRKDENGLPADFVGKLPFRWPKHPCQSYGTAGDAQHALLPFGFGLSYAEKHEDMALLDEQDIDKCPKTECWDWDCNLGQYVDENNMPNWIPQTTD